MRMWMVDPRIMCRKHLLGEHVECHMFAGTLIKGRSVQGYLDKGLLEERSLLVRHDQLSKEMAFRGYSHNSPMLDMILRDRGKVDVAWSLKELLARCKECRLRWYKMRISRGQS